MTYDANGNLTADGSGNTYVYDAWNRLVKVNNGGTTVAAYGYDGLGRRITETHGTTTTDLYLSAQGQVLEERVGGVVQARNVWSPVYVNAMVLRDQSSQHNGVLDQRLYIQQDANWNVTSLINVNGNVVERYAYDPFGAVTVLNPDFSLRGTSAYAMPYLWQGERFDGVVGLYHMGRREESPALMRFLQTDPSGQGPDVDEYRLEGDAPIGTIDPSGLDWKFNTVSEEDHPYLSYYVNNWTIMALVNGGLAEAENVKVVGEKVLSGDVRGAVQSHTSFTYGKIRAMGSSPLLEWTMSEKLDEWEKSLGSKDARRGRQAAPLTQTIIGVAIIRVNCPASSAPKAAGANSRPMFTSDWHQLLSEKHGAGNVQLISPRNPIQGLPRVGSALKTDPFHAFPNVVDNFASGARPAALPNAALYQMEGSLNGVNGRFEWIIQGGKVTHRLFVPGGTLNGVPITP